MFNIHRTREKNIDKEKEEIINFAYKCCLSDYKKGYNSTLIFEDASKSVIDKLTKKGIKINVEKLKCGDYKIKYI
jgi:hypothetical protein